MLNQGSKGRSRTSLLSLQLQRWCPRWTQGGEGVCKGWGVQTILCWGLLAANAAIFAPPKALLWPIGKEFFNIFHTLRASSCHRAYNLAAGPPSPTEHLGGFSHRQLLPHRRVVLANSGYTSHCGTWGFCHIHNFMHVVPTPPSDELVAFGLGWLSLHEDCMVC